MKMLTKTIFAIFAFVCTTQAISAQTVGKGAWMLGGSAGFSSTKVKDADGSTTLINITPNVAYFFANDIALGVRLNFLSSSANGNSDSNFGFGPYARFYVTDPIFIQAGIDFEAATLDFNSLFAGDGSTMIHAAVGYSLFLNNGVAIEPAVYLNLYNAGEALFDVDYTRFGINIGVQAFCNHDHGME
ncbi:MAG TPA: hypothetical protein VFG10_02870 [Saprospiraceae bacterium]|nr:hypothetical protein [Saprospiraceae bacterium]